MNIYFAAPLFSESERFYNQFLVDNIRQHYPEVSIYLPQEQDSINDKSLYADSKAIARFDAQKLLDSQLMICLIDGPVIDAGVASEIGIAYQAKIPILALYTDSRQQGATHPEKIEALKDIAESQFSYINLFTVGLIKLNGKVVDTKEALLDELKTYMKKDK